jgi:hypothetical protein
MPNFTQEYRSTDVGMPVLNGVQSALTAVLDAVLVNGGTAQNVTSIVEAGTTYTATIPTDVSLENLDHLTLAGITGAGAVLNTDQIIAFIDSTHFSFQGPGGLGVITGTITYKRSPLGWTKPFNATGIGAYLSQSGIPNMPQFYFRVDDSNTIPTTGGAKEAAVRGWEVMADINPGTNGFPTAAQQVNGLCWRKSLTADATARPWFLIGDGATFYFIPNSDNSFTSGRGLYGFGGFNSNKPGDAYNCMISGWSTFNAASASGAANGLGFSYYMGAYTAQTGLYVARAYGQSVVGGVQQCQIWKWMNAASYSSSVLGGANGAVGVPNPVDAAYWFDAPNMNEGFNSVVRGRPRGLYVHNHNAIPFASEFDTAINIPALPGVTLLNVWHAAGGAQGSVQFDRYGPW